MDASRERICRVALPLVGLLALLLLPGLPVGAINPNVPPVANGDSYSTSSDTATPLIVNAPGVLANDEGASLTAVVGTPPSHATSFTLNADGSFSYTPVLSYNGPDSFTYHAHNTHGDSADATVTITVSHVNRAPTLDAIMDVTVLENAITQTVNLTGISVGMGEANQTLTITAMSNNPALIPNPSVMYTSPQATGTLTYTPVANQAGTATITVTAMDNGGTANGGMDTTTRTFTITVTAVNQPPSFTKGPDQTVSENSGAQTVNPWATAISPGPANESMQTVMFNITGNTNAALFSAGPAVSPTGVLTYTPATNQAGTATITLTLHDNGGTANGGVDISAPQTFVITVTAVNQAPSFTKGPDQTVLENSGAQTVNPWATAISPGPPNESTQTVMFNITGNTNAALFSAGPAVSPTGVLTYTPATNQAGTATITLTLQDNGGTANGGVDISAPQTFVITVTAVNQAPSFTKGPDQTVLENSGAQTVNPWATAISPGPPNESTQTVMFNITGNTNAALFSAGPAVSPTGVLTYTPATGQAGTATITLTLQDNGGTANGGMDTSPPQTFVITVDAPPMVTSTTPANGAMNVLTTSAITITFDKAVTAPAAAFTIECPIGMSQAFTLSGGPTTFTLTPTSNLPANVTCTVTALAAQITDAVGTHLATNYAFSFTTKPPPPVATNDTYPQTVIGNVSINSANIPYSVTTNDTSTVPFTITAFDATSANGGTVSVTTSGAGMGQFTYNPPAGFTGNDTFTYTITNSGGSATGTVTIPVANMVWFINNTGGAGDGRLSSPFNTLAAFQAINDGASGHPKANDNIFLYDGATAYTGPLTLLNGQKLIGQDATVSLSAITGITPPSGSAGFPATGGGIPNKVQITSTGLGVTVASGNTVRGLTLGNATTALSGANFVTLTIRDLTINDTTGAAINLSVGVSDAILTAVTSGGGTNGMSLSGVGGSFTVTGDGASDPMNTTRGRTTAKAGGGTITLGSGGTIQSATGIGVNLSGGATVSLTGMTIQNNGGDGLSDGGDGLTLDNVLITGHGAHRGFVGLGITALSMQHTEVSNNATTASVGGNVDLTSLGGTASIANGLFGTTKGDAFGVTQQGFDTVTLAVTNSGFHDAAGVQVYGFRYTGSGSSTGSVSVTDSSFQTNSLGVLISHVSSNTLSFDLNHNDLQGQNSNAITVQMPNGTTGTSLLQGKVRRNTIGTAGTTDSGSAVGIGILLAQTDVGTMTVLVDSNAVRQIHQDDALFVHGGGAGAWKGTMNVTITNNSVLASSQTSTLGLFGIDLTAGDGGTPTSTGTICAHLGTSNTAGDIKNGIVQGDPTLWGINAQAFDSTTLALQNYGGAANDTAAIGTFLNTTGTVTPPSQVFISGSGTIKASSGPCPTPP